MYRVAILVIICLISRIPAFTQDDTLRISLSLKQTTLKETFQQLSAKYKINFSYSDNKIPNDTFDVAVYNRSLPGFLNDLLTPLFLCYKIVGNQYVIGSCNKPDYNAKKYTVSGFVYEKGSEEFLNGAYIQMPRTPYFLVTNSYGFFSITLPEGRYKLLTSYLGFEPSYTELTLQKDTFITIYLKHNLVFDSVTIHGNRRDISRPIMSKIDFHMNDFINTPALFGERDILKAIQLFPGIQKGNEGQSGFYVRGGGPDQNLVILDDATVYNTSHLFGFFSIFNGDAIKNIELTKGGFPARYGGRLSSVLDLKMREGNKEKYKSEVGIGLIASRFTVEGPIKKNKASFLVTGRRTYIDILTRPFLPSDSRGGYYFYDLNAKLNYEYDEKNKFYLSGYFGKDDFYLNSSGVKANSTQGFNWGNRTFTGRWNHVFGKKTFSNLSLIYSNYLFNVTARESSGNLIYDLKFSSGIEDASVKYDIDHYLNGKHHFKMGTLLTYHQFIPSATVVRDDYINKNTHTVFAVRALESGLYFEDEYNNGKNFSANAGIRVSSFANGSKIYLNPEPRFTASYKLQKNMALKGSYAIMNQFTHLLTNTGIGLPTDLWIPSTKNIKPEHSEQAAVGWIKELPKPNLVLSAEAYYKRSWDIIGYKEGADFIAVEPGNSSSIDNYSWEKIITTGRGESYGAEFLLQKKKGNLNGWIGYTLSWAQLQFDELNNGKKFWAKYDRRHDISVVWIYHFNRRNTVSLTWVYGTGNAITVPLSLQSAVSHVPGFLGFGNEIVATEYSEKNAFRMAAYHRLDISWKNTKKKKWGERIFELGCYNAYNRQNAFFYFIRTENDGTKSLNQFSLFPAIPSVSWTFRF